jgi:hypothetical protein
MSADEWSGITDADRLREALRVCPEGYAVVPCSPTNEMLAAGQPYVTGYEDMRSAYDCWHNMVAAARAAFEPAEPAMSIECGECERDLRGGHDPSCSRVRHPDCCCWFDTDNKGECGQPDASNACRVCPRHHPTPVE